MSDKKVVQMPGTKPSKSIKELLKILTDNFQDHIEFYRLKAHLSRELYSALIREGFNKKEALELTPKLLGF